MAKVDAYAFLDESLQAMSRQILADPVLLPRLSAFVQPARIRDERARLIFEESLTYLREYHRVPTVLEVLQGIRARVETGALKLDVVGQVAEYYEASHDRPPVSTQWVIDRVAEEERKTAMWSAMDNGLRLLRDGNLEQIAKEVDKAIVIGRSDVSTGTNVGATIGARTEARRTGVVTPRWGTGVELLDRALLGGLAAGELGCFLGAAKSGKSQALSHVALHTASVGGTAVTITLEMGEAAMAERQDAAITGIPIRDLAMNADEVHTKVRNWYADRQGCVVVKYMPPRETTTREIRAYLQQLRAEQGIEPNVLLVDYADLMGAVSSDYDKRHEELGVVYTELRGLAGDLKIPCWTAAQANREALSQQVVKAENMGESLKKVQICDALVAICRTDNERLTGALRLFLAMCRYTADGVMLGPLQSGYDMGRFIAGQAEMKSDV